ncbi:uncharacterized protein LOC109536196 [Dendroctonus ponderosae]
MSKLLVFVSISVAIFCQFSDVNASGKDDAKKAFHELMEVIDKALTDAQKTLDKAVEQFQAAAANLEDKAKAELDTTLEPLRKKLDDLVNKAKENGFDISKCQNYIDDFSNTPDNLVNNLVGCINTQVTDAQKAVTDALNQMKQIEEDLNTIDTDIDNCSGSKWTQAKCYAKIIAKIAKDTKDAPEKIVADVGKVTLLISNLIPALEDCFTSKLKKAGTDAAEDVAKFGICAAV